MNIAIEILSEKESNPISMVLKQIVSTVTKCQITPVAEAHLVITNDFRRLLEFLKQEKHVFQFIAWRETPATGLLTAPAFKDHFKIFVAVEGMAGLVYPSVIAMLAEIEKIRKEIEDENHGG